MGQRQRSVQVNVNGNDPGGEAGRVRSVPGSVGTIGGLVGSACNACALLQKRVVGRGHVLLLTNLDTWHSEPFVTTAAALAVKACVCAGGGRVRSHCRFRKRGPEYVSEYGMKWMSGGAERQCDRALGGGPPRWRTPPPRCTRSSQAAAR